jgi:hypothetical protein
MCQNGSAIKFCTCDIGEQKEAGVFYWTLYRYVGERTDRILGKIMPASQDLGQGITVHSVLQRLDEGDSFDFDYTPSQRDEMYISMKRETGEHKYFRVIFGDGRWQEECNPVFSSIKKTIAGGTIDPG